MEVIEKKQNGIYVLAVTGRLDSHTSLGLQEKMLGIIEAGTLNIILDCGQLDYISADGLRAILAAHKQTRESDGKIVICSLTDYIKETFVQAGFEALLPMVSNLENALKEF